MYLSPWFLFRCAAFPPPSRRLCGSEWGTLFPQDSTNSIHLSRPCALTAFSTRPLLVLSWRRQLSYELPFHFYSTWCFLFFLVVTIQQPQCIHNAMRGRCSVITGWLDTEMNLRKRPVAILNMNRGNPWTEDNEDNTVS